MQAIRYAGIRKLPPSHNYPAFYTAELDGKVLGVFSSRDIARQALRRIIRRLESAARQEAAPRSKESHREDQTRD